MDEKAPDSATDEVQSALTGGAEHAAVTRVLERYGPEVLGFLVAVLRDADAAQDVFSQFCEDVWRGLAGFRGDRSLRAWLYTVARHAAARHRREAYQRRRKPLSWAPLAELEARVRTQTHKYLRSENRSAIDRLREQLTLEERALLILRLDRKLAWNDIAAVMADADVPRSADELRQDAVTLRKRFERVKERLRKLAEAAGLLDSR